MEALLPGSPLPAARVKMFHDDNVDVIKDSGLYDVSRRLYGDVPADPLCPGPEPRHAPRPVLLRPFDPADCPVQTVVLSGEF